MALNVLQATGDDERSQYRRAVHVYAFSIALLFPPPTGAMANIKTSTILSAAKAIAAVRLFDYRVLNLDVAWRVFERDLNGMKIPQRSLQPKLAFQDPIVRSLFRDHLFNPRRGLSSLFQVLDFTPIEEHFEKRTEEMIAIADIINIYILCGPEIKKRSHYNGFDVVTNLYLSSMNIDTGERTLANNWKSLKAAAVFQYVLRYQIKELTLLTPPSITSSTFAEQILSMANHESVSKLIEIHDYVASKLNNEFDLNLPVIDTPPLTLDIRLDQDYRHQLLRLLN